MPHKAHTEIAGEGRVGLSESEAVPGVELGTVDSPYGPVASAPPAWPIVRWVQPSLGNWADARAFAPERRLATQLALPFAGACVLGGFVSGFFGWPTGLLHLLGLYHVVERLLPWLSLRQQPGQLDGPSGLVRVTLTPEALVIDRGFDGAEPVPTTMQLRWEELLGYYRSPHALVVLISAAERLPLPRVAFSELEWGLVLDALEHKLGAPRPARLRGAVRPLAVSGVVLVLWALLQAQF